MKETTESLPDFVRVGVPDGIIGDIDHTGVFYLVYSVRSHHRNSSPLGDQHDVITLQEPEKTWSIGF